jgi:seryl-tRNA synthetase
VHDLRTVRERMDYLRDGMRRRGRSDLDALLDRAENLDVERRAMIQAVEERKAARNASTQEVARRKRAGEPAEELIASGRLLGEEIARLESELEQVERSLGDIVIELPNVTLPDVPDGGEENNRIVREWGEPRHEANLLPHWEIAGKLGLLDLPRGAKIAGSGCVVFRRGGARLVRALINFFVDLQVREHDYEEVWAPAVANRQSMTGTSQLPKFEDDMYAVRDEELFLIPTGEVPVTNLYRDEILDAADLPRGFVAYTPCFRREAGSAGKDTRGLLRLHQFDKVELVRYAMPESSGEELEKLTAHAEAALKALALPYRVKLLAAGDTGFGSAKTFDLEVYSPGVGSWLEVSSCSNFLDFQSRRMNLRVRAQKGAKPQFVHTLNGSGLGFPRTIAAIIEHYQNADGSVNVPEALQPYVGAAKLD